LVSRSAILLRLQEDLLQQLWPVPALLTREPAKGFTHLLREVIDAL
jgi:hypothetical protein